MTPTKTQEARPVKIATWSDLDDREPAYALVANVDLVVIRYEINQIYGENRKYSGGEALNIAEQLHPYLEESEGISPYVEVTLSQTENLHVERTAPLSVYILAGSMIGACLFALAALFMLRAEEIDVYLAD